MNESDPPQMGPDKALAIGSYGESVAAYRYLVFAEHAPTERHRRAFEAMADEEQDELYPEADFVLSEQDKELVVVGPRLLQVRDPSSFAAALQMTLQTEQRTSGFYRRMSERIGHQRLQTVFRELADEGVEHYRRLRALAGEVGAQFAGPH
jgi:rubrerythrin